MTNVVAYRGHQNPVWDVQWSPMGIYFATASRDRTARLWSTDKISALRVYAGHLSDVDVRFSVMYDPLTLKNRSWLFSSVSSFIQIRFILEQALVIGRRGSGTSRKEVASEFLLGIKGLSLRLLSVQTAAI